MATPDRPASRLLSRRRQVARLHGALTATSEQGLLRSLPSLSGLSPACHQALERFGVLDVGNLVDTGPARKPRRVK